MDARVGRAYNEGMLQSITWTNRPLFGAVDYVGYIGWSLVAMGTIIALGLGLMVLRRKMGPDRQPPDEQAGFSIHALEEMRRRGEIDEAEFKSLRRAALGMGAPEPSEDNPASSELGGVSMNDEG